MVEIIKQRIAKVVARAGICSRRDAEVLIEERRVSLNGETVENFATLVGSEDEVKVDGERIFIPDTRLFLYYKPVGLICTNNDEKKRRTIFNDLPKGLPRLISVGRLDVNSEGLLLLTNDGELSRELELPSSNLKRTYRVRVFGAIDEAKLKSLSKGAYIRGVKYGKIDVKLEGGKKTKPRNANPDKTEVKKKKEKVIKSSANTWLVVTLTEGKNREIRNVMESLDLKVNRLIRISYGKYKLGDMKPGDVIEV
jgi:23S rRNA pseudouridine2605 synthase